MLSRVLTTIDRFATYYNAQLLRFNSSLPPPDTGAWMPWLKTGAPKTIGCVPQFILLSTRSVIASLVPILPEWSSASFWPFLRERSSQLSRLSLMCLSCLQLTIYCWRGPVRDRYIRLGLLFFGVARSSEC